MHIDKLYAGKAAELEPGLVSAILKSPVDAADVDTLGMVQDEQADLRVHGGPDQALHQYSVNSFAELTQAFPALLDVAKPGSIGENMTVSEMDDANVCIGDIYDFGEVRLQVTQPRRPCHKIDRRFGIEGLSQFIEKHCITGWYFRVLNPGRMAVGDSVNLVSRLNPQVTVAHCMAVFASKRPTLEQIDQLLMCDGLSVEWRKRLQNRRDHIADL